MRPPTRPRETGSRWLPQKYGQAFLFRRLLEPSFGHASLSIPRLRIRSCRSWAYLLGRWAAYMAEERQIFAIFAEHKTFVYNVLQCMCL
jgi:hypothetical protein